eukprot:gene10893-biopygen1799
MGPEVGPAFQRRSWDTVPFRLGVRLADTGSSHVDSNVDLEIPAFTPRSEPPHARAPGAQTIRMASGTSGWRVGISTLRTERERDREQIGHIRCWGGTRGRGVFCVLKVEIPTRQPDAKNEREGVPRQSLESYSQRPSVSFAHPERARAAVRIAA